MKIRRLNNGKFKNEPKVCGLLYWMGFESIAPENFYITNKNYLEEKK
jgi:hypothetical protein